MEKNRGEIRLCGVRIHDMTLSEALDRALEKGSSPCWVVTPNAVMLESCRRDREKAALLNRSSLSLADGAGVVLASKRRGTPLSGRVAGIDFGEALMRRAARSGFKVFLLGGGEGVAREAAEKLCSRYPGLCICGSHWGYFHKQGEEDRRVTEMIQASGADILFVCFGFPLQEEWIDTHLSRLSGLRVVAGLGGSLDVWADRVRRAPPAIARMGLEWAWRMAREPKRLRCLPALIRFLRYMDRDDDL